MSLVIHVSLVLLSLVLPSLWITLVKIRISGLMYVTRVTVTGVTFLMDITSEDQYIRSYVCHWCYCHWCYLPYGYHQWRSVYQVLCMSLVIHVSLVLLSLVLPSLWITPVKIRISGLMYVTGDSCVTGVTVTGVTFLMDNTSEDQNIRSYVCHWWFMCHWCYCHWCHLPYG